VVMKINLTPKNDVALEKIRGYEFEGKVVSLKPIPFNKSFYVIELPHHTSPTSKMILYVRVNDDPDFDYKLIEKE